MASDRGLDRTISSWLEESAPRRLPDRVLEATFERTRRSRQHLGWGARLGRLQFAHALPVLGGAAAVVVAVALGFGLYVNQPRVGADDPRSAFLGTWFSRDPDESLLTMTVRATGEAALEIVVLDDLASVCSGAPSTMTGSGRLEGAGAFVIPSPVYTCDDGSTPGALSGPPLEEQLRNLTFVHDRATETLSDSIDSVWARERSEFPIPRPARSYAVLWPQSSLAEVRTAQELADAGDPRYTWQVDPEMDGWTGADDPEPVARFLREELGWEAFHGQGLSGMDIGYIGVEYIRCAAGETNPLYPNDPDGRCAPTVDDVRYEQVSIDLRQLVRRGPTGVWAVTRSDMIDPFEQVVPPSDAESTALVEAFLRARVEGQGVEEYADVPDPTAPSHEIPLLYATTSGARYERSAFEVIEGPVWPGGWMRLRARLFAEDGAVVEQSFQMNRDDDGRLRLHYEYNPHDAAPTTEDGQAVPLLYGFPGDELTLRAAWPWSRSPYEPQTPRLITLVRYGERSIDARLAVVADPRPIERGCREGPAPADVEALIRSIRADPDLEATDPIAVTLGGLPALQLDVVAAPGASVCDIHAQTVVLTGGFVDESTRMRLYLLELPGASSPIVAIALTAPKQNFERVMEVEAALLDTFQFRTR